MHYKNGSEKNINCIFVLSYAERNECKSVKTCIDNKIRNRYPYNGITQLVVRYAWNIGRVTVKHTTASSRSGKLHKMEKIPDAHKVLMN